MAEQRRPGGYIADLGRLVASWTSADVFGWAPDPADGLLEAGAARYAEPAGRGFGDLNFHHAFALWKLGGSGGEVPEWCDGGQDTDVDELGHRPAIPADTAREVLFG